MRLIGGELSAFLHFADNCDSEGLRLAVWSLTGLSFADAFRNADVSNSAILNSPT
jgi:hypothetical protein